MSARRAVQRALGIGLAASLVLAVSAGALAGAQESSVAPQSPTLSTALINRMLACYVFVGGGSGVLISGDGLVVTNNHVIDNEDDISVRTVDGVTWPTTLLGTDPVGDIALLKIDEGARTTAHRTFTYAEFAVESDLIPGIPVVAVGNPFGLGDFDDLPTLTTGILSSGRIVRGDYTDAVQADAPVNPGNSGGPLFDLQGRLLGINGQIRSLTGFRINSGIALAVDAIQLHAFLPYLQQAKGGYARHTTLPDGLELKQGLSGVVVTSPGSSGLVRGDVLISINGRPASSVAACTGIFSSLPFQAGATCPVTFSRHGASQSLAMVLPHFPIPGLPYHGMSFTEDSGLTILDHVDGDSPAARAGLEAGDVVVKINAAPISSKISVLRAMISVEVGDPLQVTVRTRGGETKTVVLILAQHS